LKSVSKRLVFGPRANQRYIINNKSDFVEDKPVLVVVVGVGKSERLIKKPQKLNL